MKTVAFTGEILVDLVRTANPRAQSLDISGVPGGSAFNSASVLAALGIPTRFVGEVGNDSLGKWLITSAQARGLDPSQIVQRDEIKTGLAMAEVDDTGCATYDFYRFFNGTEFSPNQDALADCGWFHFGSMSAFETRNFPAIFGLTQSAKDSQMVVSFDPNVRRKPGHDYFEKLYAYLPNISILKLSEEDCESLFPDESPTDYLKLIALWNIPLTILTKGDKGASVLFKGETLDFGAEKIQVVDTIGAGDTFSAGLIYGFAQKGIDSREAFLALESKDIAPICASAIRLASAVCQVRGANLSAQALAQWKSRETA